MSLSLAVKVECIDIGHAGDVVEHGDEPPMQSWGVDLVLTAYSLYESLGVSLVGMHHGIGEKFQQQWASDDGEPQGTSGVPMLQMMVKEGITNVVVVVTRYFGGIKLGTGGLVRAYTNTAKAALEDAGIHHVKDQTVIVASMDYTYLGKLQNSEKDGYFTIADTAFTDVITVTLHCEPEDAERVKGFLSELTGGKYTLVEELETLV